MLCHQFTLSPWAAGSERLASTAPMQAKGGLTGGSNLTAEFLFPVATALLA
jgi:hypothetical protein